MPTTIIKTVKPSGGDYTSLAAAEAGEQRDLTAVDQIAQIDCYAMQDTTPVTVAGWTFDATRYLFVNVPAGQQHGGKRGTGYRIVTTANAAVIRAQQDYIRFHGLAISGGTSSGGGLYINGAPQPTHIFATDIIAYDCPGIGFLAGAGSGGVFNNCVAMNNGVDGFGLSVGQASPYSCENCVAVNNGGKGISSFGPSGSLDFQLKNCYAGGNVGADYSSPHAAPTIATSFSEDGSLGTPTVAFSTANFTNVTPGSEDLSLPAGSALIDAGTDLSTDPNWVDPGGAVDIIGTARPQGAGWDVGAFEYVAAGGTTVSSSDFGVGVSATTLKADTLSAESALGAEAVSLSSVLVGADAFSGTDQQVLEHLFSSQDFAAGADVSSVAGALVGTDSGLAEDSGNAGTLFVLSGDLGSGLDYSQLRALLAVAEDGTFGDVGQTAQVMIPSSDFAQGEDVFIALNAVLAFAEQSVGVEVSSLVGFFMSGDQGAGFDVGTMVTGVFITPGGPTYLVSAKIDSGDMEIVSSRVDAGILLSGGIN